MAEPKFSRLDADERRRQILEAATELFVESSFDSVSTSDIARKAGVTRGLLNHYFGSKRDLYLAVVESSAQRMPDAVRTDLRHLPVEEMTARNTDSWLDFVEQEPTLFISVAGISSVGRDPELEAILDKVREKIIDRIVVNQFGDQPAPPELRLLLRSFQGLVEAASQEWLVHGRATREQMHELLSSGLLALLRDVLPRLVEQRPGKAA